MRTREEVSEQMLIDESTYDVVVRRDAEIANELKKAMQWAWNGNPDDPVGVFNTLWPVLLALEKELRGGKK